MHGDHVYVLNALGGGSVQGYRVVGGQLSPLPGSWRGLNLTPVTGPNQFTSTPGQVSFTPDGSALLVTTKMNGNDIDVFSVGRDGRLPASPMVNSEPGTVPFAINFDRRGDVLIAQAGTNALATFSLSPGGALTQLSAALTGQAATCWVARAGLLRSAVDGLPGRQREVVLLRDVEGMSSADVCSVLSISEANQRVLLHRGRGKLRQMLESELGPGRSR